MDEKRPMEGEQAFDEGDVAEILERAIKLDGVRDTRVTIGQLREAAMEVGVSPEAFSRALAEFGRDRAPAEEPPPAGAPAFRIPSAIRTGLAVAFGATLGAVSGIVDGPYLHEETGALAFILLAGASLRLVLSHKKEKALLPYVVDVIWLWSSFLVALGLVTRYLGEESIIAVVAGIILASVVGGWIIKKAGTEESVRTLRLELRAPEEEQKERREYSD